MENVIVEKIQSQVKNLNVLADELRVQMALGKAEAKDLIDRERKSVVQYINAQKALIAKSTAVQEERQKSMLICVQNLESALSDVIPSDGASYDAYKKNLLHRVYKLEESIKSYYPEMKDSMKEIMDEFEIKMDAFRVNLALHDKDQPEKVLQVRQEFNVMLEKLSGLLARKDSNEKNVENFLEDISESFQYFKRAVNNLRS